MTDPVATVLQQQTISDVTTGWTQTVSFARFDPSLGTLVDVRVGLTGDVTGNSAIENLGPVASAVSLAFPSIIALAGPDGLSAAVSPDPTDTIDLAAFDGNVDFGGTSGAVVAGFSDTQTVQTVYTPIGSELADFTGTGTVALTAHSSSNASEAGGGNLLSRMLATAGARITMQYDYVPIGAATGGGNSYLGSDFTSSFVAENLGIDAFSNYITTAAQSFTIADSTTGWRDLLPVTRFDPSLGTLEAVNITLAGDVAASAAAENLSDAAMVFSATQSATVTVVLPGTTQPSVAPYAIDSMILAAFDGTADFAGTSGHSDQDLTNPFGGPVASGGETVTDPATLAALTGTGTYDLPITSTGSSVADGMAGLLSELTQKSGATVTVSYVYSPAGNVSTDGAPCFAAGTRIATEHGGVAVEALTVGQRVTLAHGGGAPIAWIGHRRIDCTRHPQPALVWPVRVRAGAFADTVPAHDLLFSPDHAIYMDDVLIPIRRLINGTTIVQEARDSVQYFHIELDRHDILLAEGLAVESFLDTGNKGQFSNGGSPVRLHP
ncbi:MAG TPA: choice-of-anchor E domain-containing protein, partial [Acetobacteraceae bacterium]